MLSEDHARARREAVRHPALVDPLTGLANRLCFDLVYNYFFEAGDRGMTFTVMLLSGGPVDEISDARIKSIGEVVASTTRTADLASHVAEGRYVVLLVGTNLPGSRIVADRIEMALDREDLGPASFGVAAFASHPKDSTALLEAAENALLAAESAGGGVEFG